MEGDVKVCTADLLPAPAIGERLAVVRGKYWQTGVTLTVGWLDNPSAACRSLILSHFREWSGHANIRFAESRTDPLIRVARDPGQGYWSYIGTDIRHIPPPQATMNLAGFTERTPDSEYRRVVRHECGHTLGCPHEHMRPAIVARLDPAAVYGYFGGPPNYWSPQIVQQQILTPIAESTLVGTAPEETSIMAYQFPGSLTRDGRPILGGTDLTARDKSFIKLVYPAR